jgi:hypothetical protein
MFTDCVFGGDCRGGGSWKRRLLVVLLSRLSIQPLPRYSGVCNCSELVICWIGRRTRSKSARNSVMFLTGQESRNFFLRMHRLQRCVRNITTTSSYNPSAFILKQAITGAIAADSSETLHNSQCHQISPRNTNTSSAIHVPVNVSSNNLPSALFLSRQEDILMTLFGLSDNSIPNLSQKSISQNTSAKHVNDLITELEVNNLTACYCHMC